MKATALIADDEPLARRRLWDLVATVEWIECLGEAEDGDSTLHAIDALRPDLVFLDIEMPGPSGLEVLEQAHYRPAVIFTTAFDRYAVSAFELQALDYLLKPFSQARFDAAVERARQALDVADMPAAAERARQAMGSPGPIARLFVRDRGKIVPIAVEDIQRIEAQDDYVMTHVGTRGYLLHLPLTEFERRLDPRVFQRVHRRHIVNLEHVTEMRPHENGRLVVHMRDGTTIVASRARSKELRRGVVASIKAP